MGNKLDSETLAEIEKSTGLDKKKITAAFKDFQKILEKNPNAKEKAKGGDATFTADDFIAFIRYCQKLGDRVRLHHCFFTPPASVLLSCLNLPRSTLLSLLI